MNEFTKDELERLFYLVHKSERIDPMDKRNYMKTYELRLKIQARIDSYCEHEKWTSDFTAVYPCKHCGELFR